LIPLTLSEVASVTGGSHTGADDRVGAVVTDSRAVTEGALFAAFGGAHVDGHNYVAAALEAGAAGALVSRPVAGVDPGALVQVDDVAAALGRLARHVLAELRRRRAEEDSDHPLRVVAVTGSYGKTTTKDLLASLLAPLGEVVAPPGSFNNEIGLPLTVLRATETTAALVLEMGADRIGNLTYLTSIAPPDVAVVLAVGRAHLGEFGGIDNVARAKSELVAGLAEGGTAVLNADDPRVAAMARVAAGREVLTFSRAAGTGADVHAEDVDLDEAGHPRFRLVTTRGSAPVNLALVGEHHVGNALAAAAVADHLGVGLDVVAGALASAGAASPHRMAVTDRADGVRVIDDAYNANPDSVRAALRALDRLAAGRRRIAVLGEMLELGDDSETEHAALGAEVAADLLITVGAAATPLARAARLGGIEVVETPDTAGARAVLDAHLRAGDVVLIKASNGTGLWRLADDLVAGADRARGESA